MLYELPYSQHFLEKTASGGPNEVVQALMSGDFAKMASVLSEEDQAFFAISPDTLIKVAECAGSGRGFTEDEINALSETDLAALTLLGDDPFSKVAHQLRFIDDFVEAETGGRMAAHETFSKMAAKARQQEMAKAAEEEEAVRQWANTPEGREKIAAAIKAEREKRSAPSASPEKATDAKE